MLDFCVIVTVQCCQISDHTPQQLTERLLSSFQSEIMYDKKKVMVTSIKKVEASRDGGAKIVHKQE